MKKNLKSFLREEDWKTIKKSLLISSLWLIVWFWIDTVNAACSNTNVHNSSTWTTQHTSTHCNHSNHSSY